MDAIIRKEIDVEVDNKFISVVANLLGGEDGVFGTCRNPNDYNQVWLIGGDDGAWWYIASYHESFISGIIAAIKRA